MKRVVILDGGLGNNLFQISYALNLKLSHPGDNVVIFDLYRRGDNDESQFLTTVSRHLGLEVRKQGAELSRRTEIISRVKRLIGQRKIAHSLRSALEKTRLGDTVFYRGYWQSCSELTMERLAVAKAVAKAIRPRAVNSPAAHVRLGDYTNSKNRSIYVSCGHTYYSQAIEIVHDQNLHQNIRIVSNDPRGAKALLSSGGLAIDVVETGGVLDDFEALASHHTLICSNSTFCWWAALTGIEAGTVNQIIAPKKWLTPAFEHRDHADYRRLNAGNHVFAHYLDPKQINE